MIDLMAHKVNLDALIERADFEIESAEEGESGTFILPELKSTSGTYRLIRKPQFQRATSDWSPQQVVALVKNFVDRDLIPAIIIWNSPARLKFVMDGAHRLSALIAWVNDDYGYGKISQAFEKEKITAAQIAAHNATKELMAEQVGTYADLERLGSVDGNATTEQGRRARGMTSLPIVVQDYNKPDRLKAEASFYRINQGGTPLNPEERENIRTRQWPESIAARAIWRIGRGTRYWSKFPKNIADDIELIASEIQTLLLKPELETAESPLRLPLISTAYTNSGIGLMDQFIHLANDLPARDKTPGNFDPLPENDPKADKTGEITLEYLKKGRKLAEQIASKRAYSLGLHPGVYAYAKSGKFLPSAFFAEVTFMKDLIDKDEVIKFAKHREAFEEYLVTHKHHLTLLTHDVGSKMKSVPTILRYFQTILGLISRRRNVDKGLEADEEFARLISNVEPPPAKRGSKIGNASLPMALRECLDSANKCEECGARIYKDAWTHGHRKAASDGGVGHSDNLGYLHPVCNSGVQEQRRSKAKK